MASPGLRRRVEALPGQPLPNGLLNPGSVTIIDVAPEDGHELLGVDWLPQGCCDAYCWEDCPPEESGSPGERQQKLFCSPEWHTAPPVTVYSGVECSTIGWGYDEAVTQARTALQLGQQRALEQWVWTNILAPRAIDRTPASGPVGIPQAMGLLEGWLAVDYGGVGVVHVPAAAGPLLCAHNQLRREAGGRMRTCASGHHVVVGGGYQVNTGPDGQPAPEGTVWLAISGPVVVRREAIQIVPGTDKESVRISTNDRMVLAERNFVVQVSCAVEMVLACLDCC